MPEPTCGHRWRSVSLLHRSLEGFWPCKQCQSNAGLSTGKDWRGRRLVSKLWVDQGVAIRLIGIRRHKKYSDWDRSWTRMLFFTDFIQLIRRVYCKWSSCRVWRLKSRRQVIRTVKYADGTTGYERQSSWCRKMWNGNECGISRQPFLVQIVMYQKQLEKIEYFNYLSSLVTSDAR
jgi:hypothetical protein